jgi:gamma-glutamyltranspeptidase/glutathione hydrolase
VEARFPADVLESLKQKGHDIVVEDELWYGAGQAQGILIRNGVLMGGADPRGDGAAIGY